MDRERREQPFKCWCPNDRENVVRLRAKYEVGQLCKVCAGVKA